MRNRRIITVSDFPPLDFLPRLPIGFDDCFVETCRENEAIVGSARDCVDFLCVGHRLNNRVRSRVSHRRSSPWQGNEEGREIDDEGGGPYVFSTTFLKLLILWSVEMGS